MTRGARPHLSFRRQGSLMRAQIMVTASVTATGITPVADSHQPLFPLHTSLTVVTAAIDSHQPLFSIKYMRGPGSERL